MRTDHSQLAPVLFDFVPKGRGKEDVMLYKMLRWHARKNRQEFWDVTQNALIEAMKHGSAFIKTYWS